MKNEKIILSIIIGIILLSTNLVIVRGESTEENDVLIAMTKNVTNIGYDSVVFNGYINKLSFWENDVIGYFVFSESKTDLVCADTHQIDDSQYISDIKKFNKGNFFVSVNSLKSDTKYYYRACAETNDSKNYYTAYGEVKSFFTKKFLMREVVIDNKKTVIDSEVKEQNSKFKGIKCSSELTLTQNLKAPAIGEGYVRNGKYHGYTRGIVKEAHILQKHLNRLGFNAGKVDGIIGPNTRGAILRMQKYLGTKQDGFVGPKTRALLNNSCQAKEVETKKVSQNDELANIMSYLQQKDISVNEKQKWMQELIKLLANKKTEKKFVEKDGYEYEYYDNGQIKSELKKDGLCIVEGKTYAYMGGLESSITSKLKNGWYYMKSRANILFMPQNAMQYYLFDNQKIKDKLGTLSEYISEGRCKKGGDEEVEIGSQKITAFYDSGMKITITFTKNGYDFYRVYNSEGNVIYELDLAVNARKQVEKAEDATAKVKLLNIFNIALIFKSENQGNYLKLDRDSEVRHLLSNEFLKNKKIGTTKTGWAVETQLNSGKYFCVDSNNFHGELSSSSIKDGENSEDVVCGN